jgi:hypothetical protein
MKNVARKYAVSAGGLGLLVLLVFRGWFGHPEIIGGDWPYVFGEMVRELSFIPTLWQPIQGSGLGGIIQTYPLSLYFNTTAYFFAGMLHLPWTVYTQIFWFGMYIFLAAFCSFRFISTLFPRMSIWGKLIGSLVYIANTYVLMIVAGGQMGIALAYAVAPMVLGSFIKQSDEFEIQNAKCKMQLGSFKFFIIAGLWLALQVMFDVRIAYITMLAAGAYGVYILVYRSEYREVSIIAFLPKGILYTLYSILYTFAPPLFIALLLHAYWILPVVLSKVNLATGSGFSLINEGTLQFFSFAKFEDSLSLLHPNWPENIFGKVYFMRWEFLVLPLIAFGWLARNYAKQDAKLRKVLFLAVVGLIGAFLAKGVNEPFGFVYSWLFHYFPGFSLFRDPTKWYVLVALAYMVLIPYSIESTRVGIEYRVLSIITKNTLYSLLSRCAGSTLCSDILYILFTLYFIFTLRPAVLGGLPGTFALKAVPQEYVELKNFLHEQPAYFRTLWVPAHQRFAFYSQSHPAVDGKEFFNVGSASAILTALHRKEAAKDIQEAAIKYVIVPFDSEGELFINDRKYEDKQYLQFLNAIEKIGWLKKERQFGKIVVFKALPAEDHFWFTDKASIHWQMVSPVQYTVKAGDFNKERLLVFSEHFDKGWYARLGSTIIYSKVYKNRFNSFLLPASDGNETIEVLYKPQEYVYVGFFISGITGVLCLFFCADKRTNTNIEQSKHSD